MSHKLGALIGMRVDLEPASDTSYPEVVTCPPVPDLRMDGNDVYGDCTIAGVDHVTAVWNVRESTSTLKRLTPEALEAAYFRLTGGADSGLPEQRVVSSWEDSFIFGYKIPSATQLHPSDIRSVIARQGVAYLGVALPESAEQQFAAGEPWSVVPSNIAGGHCVVGCAYDADYLTVITWGRMQQVTWEWWATYGMELWSLERP